MANPSITMSEETKKFQEAVAEYFSYNRTYGYLKENGYLLLLLLYLVKNDAIKLINSKKLTNAELSKLKVLFCYPFKNLNGREMSEELDYLYSCDCCVINLLDKEKEILEIADGLGINLEYDFHKNYGDINFVSTLFKLISISPVWYKENSLWAFEEICGKISFRYNGVIQSKELISLLVKLLDAKSGDIYYPYANRDIVEYIKANGISKDIMSFIQTLNTNTFYLIRLILLYNDLSVPYIITDTDSIDDWHGNEGFDYMLATPPWAKCKTEYRTAELDFLARSSRDVLHKSIGVYNSYVCYNGNSKSIIKELVDNDWLEAVILLPKNMFYHTGIEQVIILVNKYKKHNGLVRIIDASDCCTKYRNILGILDTNSVLTKFDDNNNLIPNSEISSLGYNVYPRLYLSRNNADIPENYRAFKVNDVLDFYTGDSYFSETEGKVVNISDLSDNSLSSKINIDNLKMNNDLISTIKVTEPVFLFSKKRELKPTYCDASPENPIFIHPNIWVYKLKSTTTWVDYQYFCYELSRRANFIAKELVPGISRSILQLLNVYFPSQNIEDQKRIVKEAIYQQKISQAKEIGLQEVIERMKAEYINEVRNRKHEMGPYIATLTDIHEDLMNFRFQEKCPEYYNEFNYQCGRFERALNGLKSLVSILSDEIESSDVIDLNINDYFTSLVKRHDSKYEGYNLIYNLDIDKNDLGYENLKESDIPFYTEIAKAHFDSLINNIIQNAKRHGFVDSGNKNYTLEIRLSLNSEDSMFQIDFINNGNPLPKGMDKKHYGILGEKAGKTANNGEGGYRVKSIVTLYNGDYDVFMDNYNTVIRILLPISKNKYEQDV